MDSIIFHKQCWRYYLVLEDDFRKIERYITFQIENMGCFSIEFLKQYQAICSETDVICKMYCEFLSPEDKRNKILHYANIILSHKIDFTASEVKLKNNNNFILKPWIEWSCNHLNFADGNDPLNISPKWWALYNKVKHQRLDNVNNGVSYYKSATFGNTINALAALYVLELNFYKDLIIYEGQHNITVPAVASKLLIYSGWESHIIHLSDGMVYDVLD